MTDAILTQVYYFDTFPSCQTEVCKNHSQRSTKIFFTNKTEVSLNAQCTGE